MILIAGCASVATAPPAPLPAIAANFFTLQGRISVRVGDKLESGRVSWIKLATEERIELFTPFGGQVAELIKPSSGRVTLRRGHEIESAATMEALTMALLGVPLDTEEVARWTQAIGLTDDIEAEKSFSNGDKWRVTAFRVQARGNHQFASRISAIRGDTVVRLVIDEWLAQ
jgi:outer membrane biogenesis lipoprotein LolB